MKRSADAEIDGYVAPEMVMTPWGDTSTLRDRRLPPGRGQSRADVQQNQRERLFAAMVAITAEKGYAATSVSDLAELSGVSSRSFYELFAGKEDCFLATVEEILKALQTLTLAKLGGEGTMEERGRRMSRVLTKVAAAQPETARLWLVESFSAGDRARQRIDDSLGVLVALMEQIFKELPGQRGMPPEVIRGILGGIGGVLYGRLARDEVETIPALGSSLYDWVLSIPAPPGPLRPKGRRGKPRGGSSPPFAAHVPGERVLRGFTAVVASKGYAATTVADVAAAASISQNTFYAHFRDKEDAFYAALDSSGAQMLAATLPAIRRAPQWPEVVQVAMETQCAFLAAEPHFAHLRQVEVYAVGPRAVMQRDLGGKEIVSVLAALSEGQRPTAANRLTVEASVRTTQSLMYEWIRGGRVSDLHEVAPIATYVYLAPLIGAEAAYEVACG